MPIHQLAIDRIRASIARSKPQSSDCGCHHMADVYVAFPDGSFKRPDVSIFCRMPEDLSRAVDLVPEAVIEVISVDYESKDLISGPPFYLGQGVKDVVTCNPLTSEVHHFRRDGTKRLSSPSTITLECGCVCTV